MSVNRLTIIENAKNVANAKKLWVGIGAGTIWEHRERPPPEMEKIVEK